MNRLDDKTLQPLVDKLTGTEVHTEYDPSDVLIEDGKPVGVRCFLCRKFIGKTDQARAVHPGCGKRRWRKQRARKR